MHWTKLGRLLVPDPSVSWLVSHTGPTFARVIDEDGLVELLISGRDARNRSRIGRATFRLDDPTQVTLDPEPVLDLGAPGTFDENGTAYPFVVDADGEERLYYVGWMPTVITPFQNHVGVAAKGSDGRYHRLSRAPILPRTDAEPFGTGSVGVARDGQGWVMWYTAFDAWEGDPPREPTYDIRLATSDDGLVWRRDGTVAIPASPADGRLCRPAVYSRGGVHHVWYAYRGAQYRIGYGRSADGRTFSRHDDQAGLACGPDAWDSEAMAYPCVFAHGAHLYMVYCGNGYGREGLGLARLPLDQLESKDPADPPDDRDDLETT